MKPTIVKNVKNLYRLKSLISNDFYFGFVEDKKFELSRNNFPNNFRIIGVLNERNSFDLKFDYKSPINFLIKVLFALNIFGILYSLFKGNWILLVVLILIILIQLISFKIKEKKEITLFIDKLLSLNVRES